MLRVQVICWVIVVSALAGCSSTRAESAPKTPPPEVSVARVVTENLQPWEDFTGRLQAVNTVEVHPRVSGHIDDAHFTEGAHVDKGQLLFRIDQRPFQQQVDRLDAERRRTRSQLELSKAARDRGERLLETGAISREGFDQATAAYAAAAAAIDAVSAQLAAAQLDLDFTRVRAPIAGRVSRALITAGNLVSPSSLLTTIVSDGDIHVYFDVDEAVYLQLSRKSAKQRSVQMGLSDEQGYPREGTLDFFDNQLDPRTGTIRARALFHNDDGRLVPGLFARVRLRTGEAAPALLLDEKAVLTDQDRKYVYVLDGKNRAQRKNIVLGRAFEGLRVASSGLGPEDRVIVHGVQKIFFPGMPVKPSEIAMGTPPKAAATQSPAR